MSAVRGSSPGVLIIARSGRALAASVVRAGYRCDVIDEFLDADTRALARWARRIPEGLSSANLTPVLETWQDSNPGAASVILPGSGFEAEPDRLTLLQNYGAVAANPAALVQRLKDPAQFFPLLDSLGIRRPRYSLEAVNDDQRWLCKPVGGEGGVGIRPWYPGEPLLAGCYLQAYCPGESLSVVFLADGRRARVVGFNQCRTLGELNDTQADYRYAELVRIQPPAAVANDLTAIVDTLVRATGLRGLCGMDLIRDTAGINNVLEVNPRPPASFELHENLSAGDSLVAAHLAACAGVIPQRAIAADKTEMECRGKRVVYAPAALQIPDGFNWPAECRDRPPAGSRVEADEPLCTIVVRAADPEACRATLEQHEHELLDDIKKIMQQTEYKDNITMKEVTA